MEQPHHTLSHNFRLVDLMTGTAQDWIDKTEILCGLDWVEPSPPSYDLDFDEYVVEWRHGKRTLSVWFGAERVFYVESWGDSAMYDMNDGEITCPEELAGLVRNLHLIPPVAINVMGLEEKRAYA
jgi:hypothetical protein